MKTQIMNQHIDPRNAHKTTNVGAKSPQRYLGQILRNTILQVVAIALLAGMASAQGNLQVLTGSTPGFVSWAKDLGPADPGKQITVSVWLKRHNDAAFRELLRQQYTPGSATYHQWLTTEQYAAMFGPSPAEASQVGNFLKSHNLRVTKTDKYNQFVTAEGSVANVQSAFHVQIDRFNLNGKTYRANTSDAAIEGPAGALSLAVLGLDDLAAEAYVRQPLDPATGHAVQVSMDELGPAGFTGNCWGTPGIDNFPTSNGYFQYSGNKYTGTLNYNDGVCGYTPAQLQHAYGIDQAYSNGYNGQGQTVSIVIGYGSPTISQDLSTFDGYFSLPAATLIITDGGNTGSNAKANLETTLDVESSHALAPGAWIDLFVAPDLTFANLLTEESEAVTYNCVTINSTTQCSYQISNSWGAPETTVPASTLLAFDSTAATAAAKGISVNFASGDNGDFLQATGTAQVSWPASDPSVTAVGGTSMFLRNDGSGDILFQTGWGTNLTRIVQNGVPISPDFLGFQGGAGGGISAYWAEPSWQSTYGLSGNRHVPDIAYLADGNTGALIIESYDQPAGVAAIEPVGGTSLATPMFSAVWAITNQWTVQNKGVSTSLGLAAGNLYTSLGIAGITDIQQSSYSSEQPSDVWGEYCVPGSVYSQCDLYTTDDLAGVPFNWGAAPSFVSAQFADSTASNANWYVLTFGTDSSLHTATGWDNVTGLGVPNGWNFVTAFIQPTSCWTQNGQTVCD